MHKVELHRQLGREQPALGSKTVLGSTKPRRWGQAGVQGDQLSSERTSEVLNSVWLPSEDQRVRDIPSLRTLSQLHASSYCSHGGILTRNPNTQWFEHHPHLFSSCHIQNGCSR